jgi:protein RPN4
MLRCEDQSSKIGDLTSVFMEEWSGEYLPVDVTQSVPNPNWMISDNDELYRLSKSTSAPSMETQTPMLHPPFAVLPWMFQATNNQNLSVPSRSPLGGQAWNEKFAFREGSPFSFVSKDFDSLQMRFGSSQQVGEQEKANRILQQQIRRTPLVQMAPNNFHEAEEDSAMTLFLPQYRLQPNSAQEHGQSDMGSTVSQQNFPNMSTSGDEFSPEYLTWPHTQPPSTDFTFAPPLVPGEMWVPQQNPFILQQRKQLSKTIDRSPEFPCTLLSKEISNDSHMKKPTGSTANGGTYTCTYHGCTLRFETLAKLQKHKRKGHRQSATLVGSLAALTTASQAGPHICTRIRPSTGRQCDTVFSRPYDLTRHEDTVHNPGKVKVRCPLCKEDRTFNRSDAFKRHLKKLHPSYSLPTKSRRGQH